MLAKNFKKSLLAVNIGLVMSAGFTGAAYAADETKVQEDVEVIEVRGIRRSLEASMNTKRFADSVVDAVSAEDIGKFPDGDVGEALGRISGVAVNRQFGQGQQVSIRGASSQLTRTLLNGQTVASTGWYDQQSIDRSFNYTLLPPELVGEIQVYKSSQADIVEGGVGGTVIVNTRKPLDLDAGTTFLSAKADYGTISEETDPQVSGLFSWKNDEETFGLLGSVSWAETNYQRNGIESLIGWGDIVPTTFQQERERTALNATFQYRPTENLELGLNIMSLELDANNANTSNFVMFPDDKEAACEQKNASGTCTFYRRTGEGANPGWVQTWARIASMTSDTADFSLKYEGENFTLKGRLGTTESEGGTDLTANYGNFIGVPSDYAGTYDATGEVIKIDINNKYFEASDFAGPLSPAGWALKKQPNTDEETYAQFDLSFPVEFGAITAIKTGFRWADHEVKQETYSTTLVDTLPSGDGETYYSGTMSSGAGFTLPEPDFDKMVADARAAISSFDNDSAVYRSGYGTIEEENFAVYAMAEFSAESIRGNFGLRYISTDAESDYYGFANGEYESTLSTDKASYNDILPSINIAFDIAEDVILRTSAAQVIARPNYTDMFSASSFAGYSDGTANNEVLTKGNVGLNPFKATQADLGIEWYFDGDGMVSATYFFKDITSFVTSSQILNQQIGVVDPDTQGDNWTLSTKLNASGGQIEGIELQIQDGFDSGFGYSANYTFVDAPSEAENYPDMIPLFSDSSKHTVNLVGYYETDTYSARLAYNWRSEYMIRELPGFYGNREHQSYGTLDFSANYSVTDNIDVTFEAVNLTEEDSVQIGVAPSDAEVVPELRNGYPAWSFEGEARYKLGVSLRF
ncbi:TonB-dependent receptor [Pseudoalteromonas lipolytica]|uniref:TonB-dependent receptor n=2 Tax=Pseudoalteromonas TaxID=53246 RepID=A0AAD0RYY0_9GAMM|nr:MULTISPECIES: TonB-dependent receptor [Pseudoalteromonas]AXV64862.1 TonB-dependent receptor [Pseudoalteromonas donghaensis]